MISTLKAANCIQHLELASSCRLAWQYSQSHDTAFTDHAASRRPSAKEHRGTISYTVRVVLRVRLHAVKRLEIELPITTADYQHYPSKCDNTSSRDSWLLVQAFRSNPACQNLRQLKSHPDIDAPCKCLLLYML